MGFTLDSEISGPIRNVPKKFISALRVESGPFAGEMAQPCLCGYPTDPNAEDVALIRWDRTGKFMFVHRDCVRSE